MKMIYSRDPARTRLRAHPQQPHKVTIHELLLQYSTHFHTIDYTNQRHIKVRKTSTLSHHSGEL